MTDLIFSDLTISVDDLAPRAKSLSEEQQSDVLGGFGWFKSRRSRMMRSRRMRRVAMLRRRQAMMRARSQAVARRRQRAAAARRRGKRSFYLRKAAYHSRLAASYRRAARG